jgi:phosphatidylglycerophosphatase A
MTDEGESRRFDGVVFLASGLGLGFSPIAPGTVGTLWGLPLALGISRIPSLPGQVLVIGVLLAVGVPLCTEAARRLGRKDPGAVVWDEIATVPITFFLVPAESISQVNVLVTGFVLHRFFDITKLPPINQLEKLPDGLGIMADDVAAGIYSCITLHLLLEFVFRG